MKIIDKEIIYEDHRQGIIYENFIEGQNRM